MHASADPTAAAHTNEVMKSRRRRHLQKKQATGKKAGGHAVAQGGRFDCLAQSRVRQTAGLYSMLLYYYAFWRFQWQALFVVGVLGRLRRYDALLRLYKVGRVEFNVSWLA